MRKQSEERRMPMEDILMRTYDEEIRSARNGFVLNILAILAIIFVAPFNDGS